MHKTHGSGDLCAHSVITITRLADAAIVPQLLKCLVCINGQYEAYTQMTETVEKRSSLLTWAVMIAAFLVALNFTEIRDKFGGAVLYDAARAGDVVLYGTTWCGYCRKTRQYFVRHNIPFEDLDIEQSSTAYTAFERLGGRGVPLVTVGNEVVYGYNLSRLRKLLECADCTD